MQAHAELPLQTTTRDDDDDSDDDLAMASWHALSQRARFYSAPQPSTSFAFGADEALGLPPSARPRLADCTSVAALAVACSTAACSSAESLPPVDAFAIAARSVDVSLTRCGVVASTARLFITGCGELLDDGRSRRAMQEEHSAPIGRGANAATGRCAPLDLSDREDAR